MHASAKIFDAAERGDVSLLKQCLASNVPIDTPDPRKSPNGVPTKLTPLHWACRNGQTSAVAALLEAGNHGGATHAQLQAFARAALRGEPPAVGLRDGSKAVLMGIAAHRSIDTGRPVLWREMLDEFEAARAQYAVEKALA